ncbi:MAG TPA: chemotaxis protein CheW [Stellaceae bacterium]|jgi:purine-binding chemotaxis protein CheW|nr:chemotaxis protein CheW [Stellaceae bacterium]
MSDNRAQFLDRAAALRDAFDRSFAEPLPPDPPPFADLLAIRIGTEPYALRLCEIAGLFADRKITPIASRVPALLGIVGHHGAIVPVYDLHVLLEHRAVDATRWLATAADTPVAFAFAAQEGQLRCRPDAIVPHQSDGPARRHAREFIRIADLVRPIVDLGAVIAELRRQVPAKLNAANLNMEEC